MDRPVRTRFAPSPTGALHLGNARVAVVAWLFARRHGGGMWLRFDDTDTARSREEAIAAIREDLAWLGLDWEGELRQSARTAAHEEAFATLVAAGRAYPCFEEEEELAAMRQAARAAGRPPRYDRRALALAEAERARLLAAGRRPYWRFRLSDAPVVFHDLIMGPQRLETRHLSDPVIRRRDGRFTWIFAGVVDDRDLAITHVIRGQDHLTNTAVQLELFAALGTPPPAFAHLPLLLDPAGRPLAKRMGGWTLGELRARGIPPEVVVAVLARLGTAIAPQPEDDLTRLLTDFDLAAYGRAPVRVDPQLFDRLAVAFLRRLAPAEAARRLAPLLPEPPDPAFIALVRDNLTRPPDVRDWWRRLRKRPAAPPVEDRDLLALALARLPAHFEGREQVRAWLAALARESERTGRRLYRPLRLALTGCAQGPPLDGLLAWLGAAEVRARLAAALALGEERGGGGAASTA